MKSSISELGYSVFGIRSLRLSGLEQLEVLKW